MPYNRTAALLPLLLLLLLAPLRRVRTQVWPGSGCYDAQVNITRSVGDQWLLPDCGGLATCTARYGIQVAGCSDPDKHACHRVEPAEPGAEFPHCCPKITCEVCYSARLQRYFSAGELWTEEPCVLHHCESSPSGLVSVVRRSCQSLGAPPPYQDCQLVQQDMTRGDYPHCCAFYRCPGHCLSGDRWLPVNWDNAPPNSCTRQKSRTPQL